MKVTALLRGWAWLSGIVAFWVVLGGCGHRGAGEHLHAGIAKLKEGNYGEAIGHLEAASKSLSDNATLHCNLGIALWKTGDTAQATVHLNRAADLTRYDPRPLEFLARVLMETRDWERARVALDRANRRVSTSPRILTAMAAVEWHAGRPEPARTLLLRALDLNPEYAPALYNLGVVNRDALRDYAKAAEFFRRYLEAVGELQATGVPSRDRHVEVARQFLAHIGHGSAVRERAVSSAVPSAASLPSPSPSGAESPLQAARRLLREGMNAQKNGDLDRAVSSYKRALGYDPHMAVAAYNLGLAYKAKGELDLAQKAFLTALRDAPEMVDARYMLGVVYWEKKQNAKAVEQLESVLQLDHNHAKAHYLLGVIRMEENRSAEARKHFEEFVRIESTGPASERVRAWLERTRER